MKRERPAKFFTPRNIAYLAVLTALVVVLQLYASTIPVGGGAQLNFALVPIVLGGILLGWGAGAFLGLACGIVVLIQVVLFAPTVPFYAAIWTNSPVITSFTCLLKTTVAGGVAGLVYKLIARKNSLVAVFVASALVPVINTGLFIIGCLCMSGTIGNFGQVSGIDILVFILVGIVTFNFFIEFAVNLVIAPAIHRVVIVVEKQIRRKRGKQGGTDGALPEDEPAPQPQTETKS